MADDKIIYQIVFENDQAIATLKKTEKAAQDSGNVSGKGFSAGFAGAISGAFTSIRKNIAGIGAALAGAFIAFRGLKDIISDLTSFTTSLAEVKTIVSDVSAVNKEFTAQLIETAAQFGTTSQEQAKAFYQIISAGVTDSAKATELLIQANTLAVGGLTSTTGAVDLLTSAVNAFGQANLSAARAADITFGIVRLGKTTVEELQGSLGQILPSASALKVSFEDVGAALAAITTRGVSTSEAVTQLNAILTAVLKKQSAARELGEDVAKAFSLQALKTKGLTLFLKDLNEALGGSEEKLVKLLGRAEGARAIITLAGDNFKTLANNVDQLKNSSGAAGAALEQVFGTVGKQLDVFSAAKDALILKFSLQGEGALFNALTSINGFLLNAVRNFDDFQKSVTETFRTIGIAIASALIVFQGGAAIAAMRLFFTTLKTQSISAFATLGAQINIVRTNFQFLRIGGVGTFRAIGISAKLAAQSLLATNIAVKALKFGFIALKAAATFGLTLVLDAAISKFLELQDKGFSFIQVIQLIGRSIGQFITQNIANAAGALSRLAGSVGLGTISEALAEVAFNSQISANAFTLEIEKMNSAMEKLKATSGEAKDVIGSNLGELNTRAEAESETWSATMKQVNQAFSAGVVKAISFGVQTIARSLVKGGDAFDNFGAKILQLFGALAIQMGEVFLATGIGILALNISSGTGAIAAGLGLIALGAILSAVGESAPPTAGAAIGGAGGEVGPGGGIQPIQQSELEETRATTNVTINVDRVLNRREEALELAQLLNEAIDGGDVNIRTGQA